MSRTGLVVAKANVDNDEQNAYIKNTRGPLQSNLAHELHEKAGVPLGQCGIQEVKKFETYLTDYQVNIVSKEHLNSLISSGPEAPKLICLYAHDNHYDIISSMPAFLARKKYCHTCKKGYDKIEDHLAVIPVSCAIHKTVPLLAGCFVKTAIGSLKAKSVSTGIKREWARNDRFVHPS